MPSAISCTSAIVPFLPVRSLLGEPVGVLLVAVRGEIRWWVGRIIPAVLLFLNPPGENVFVLGCVAFLQLLREGVVMPDRLIENIDTRGMGDSACSRLE